MTAEPLRQPQRDYAAEMREYMSKHRPEGDVVLANHAEWMIRRLQQKDPDLLMGWLMLQAPVVMADYMRLQFRRDRQATRRKAVSSAFASGDAEGVRPDPFEKVHFVIDEHNTWRPLGEMTGKDHRFVADGYERQSAEAKLKAAFHKAVAKRVGTKKTADVLTTAQYEAMWEKLVG